MANQLTPVQEEQKRQLQEMTPELRKKAKIFADKLAKGDAAVILTSFDCGKMVQEFLADEAAYGEDAIPRLARFLNLHPSQQQGENQLYSMRSFSVAYTREAVVALVARRGLNGKTITINHFYHLSAIKNVKIRTKYEEMVFTEALSVDQLAKELRAKGAKDRTSNGGRKPNPPRNADVGFQQIYELCNGFQSRHALWDVAIYRKVMDAAPVDLDANLFNRVTAAEDGLTKLIASAKEDLEEVRRCKVRISKVVKGSGGDNPDRTRAAAKKSTKKKSTKKKSAKPAAVSTKKKKVKTKVKVKKRPPGAKKRLPRGTQTAPQAAAPEPAAA